KTRFFGSSDAFLWFFRRVLWFFRRGSLLGSSGTVLWFFRCSLCSSYAVLWFFRRLSLWFFKHSSLSSFFRYGSLGFSGGSLVGSLVPQARLSRFFRRGFYSFKEKKI